MSFSLPDSQNEIRASELFILRAALHRKAVNTSAFIADHLNECAKSTNVVINRGYYHALAKALGYSARLVDLSILYSLSSIDLITCVNTKTFKVLNGGWLWLNHHCHVLFALPNEAKTTITLSSNLIYHDNMDGVSGVMLDGSSDDDGSGDDDVNEVPRGQSGRRRAPTGPSTGSSCTADATSSRALDPSMF